MSASTRLQRTINRVAEVSGFGFFGNADVTLRFLPADEHAGIAFQRTDLPDTSPVPALVEYALDAADSHRRTTIEAGGARIEMIEHVMAALAGLQIDNCLVQLNAAEPPGMDGSSLAFCNALLDAGIVEQTAPAHTFTIGAPTTVRSGDGELRARPHIRHMQAITYELDYGQRSPIIPQLYSIELTPEVFVQDIAFARTFIREDEIKALRARGYGQHVTAQDLLIFGSDGIVDNQLRAPDECVRHKILDCIGDFALLGGEIHGYINAWRSGHALNRELVRRIKSVAWMDPAADVREAA